MVQAKKTTLNKENAIFIDNFATFLKKHFLPKQKEEKITSKVKFFAKTIENAVYEDAQSEDDEDDEESRE